MTRSAGRFALTAAMLLFPIPALANVNTGDTAWVLTASAMVLLMTPGLAFFYAGMVRSKNVVATLYQNVITMAVAGLIWAIIGFSLAFSNGGAYLGGTHLAFLKGVGQNAEGAATIPYLLFMAFQMMFAIITPALITGAFVERVRFVPWLIILSVWSLVVYAPVAHWVWGPGGWLSNRGALDFAGGLVVHMTAGFSALVAALVLGRRKDFGTAHRPHDVGMVVLGTALLWFGWFGFNGGSALGANGVASHAFVTTFLSSAVAFLVWVLFDSIKDGKPTIVGGCIGVVAGLVAITPAAGYVTPAASLFIGATAGLLCNLVARLIRGVLKVDDSLDVFACHGIGGLLGVIATGLFATSSVNSSGADGLLNGGDLLFGANMLAAFVIAVYSMVATFFIIRVVDLLIPVRVSDEDETTGLDTTQHGESIHA